MDDLIDSLPTILRERTRALNEHAPNPNADYILYWMHHAMRADNNPALDLALWIGEQMDKPVLVYQGLSGHHAHNNDRHHLFILQGARDVARTLKEREIRYSFFLPQHATDRSPLKALIQSAAVAVMEQMPVAPFNQWQSKLAEQSKTYVVDVDTRCIVPMMMSAKPFARAFAFRDHYASEYQARISAGWTFEAPQPVNTLADIAFSETSLIDVDDETLLGKIARLPIDHSVGPIADTCGGSSAARKRWQQFANEGLRRYDQTRNDAARSWPNSVSRLSPYFHYGMLSPFRVASEAHKIGGKGAQKFIDELTIWRELAHHFCWHCDDPDSLHALPSWAQATLRAHAGDTREQSKTLRQLANAESDQPLWDLCQRSLLVHGELHNNLRMTWAKAIPLWTSSPDEALSTLVTLNHRYALDGNDPSSYGGLLWALGLFDRPFKPEQAILGSVRPRSIAAHQKRLDMQTYRAKIMKPQGKPLRIAVIGAGVSGLSAASVLARNHHEVVVFEKSRGPGGRSATRRQGDYHFDHGAQYFTVRDERMMRHIDDWQQEGTIEFLAKRTARIERGKTADPAANRQRYRGKGGMNQLCKSMASGLTLVTQTHIRQIESEGDQWRLQTDDKDAEAVSEPFDIVISSAPATQTAYLLRHAHPRIAGIAESVNFTPCWAVMLRTENAPPDYDAGFVEGSPIAWLATDQAADGSHCWVLHASTSWSEVHLEEEPEQIVHQLVKAFSLLTQLPVIEDSASAHRWRFARVLNPLGDECLFDPTTGIGACGDWCHDGARVESAWLSGQAIAGRVLAKAFVDAETAAAPQKTLFE